MTQLIKYNLYRHPLIIEVEGVGDEVHSLSFGSDNSAFIVGYYALITCENIYDLIINV
jgi:hypothetical protein